VADGAAPAADPFDVVDGGVVLRVRVQPGASRVGLAGRHGDAVRLRVTAPPVDGRANAAVEAALATVFHLRPAQVRLVTGASGRSKRVRLDGVDAERVRAILSAQGAL